MEAMLESLKKEYKQNTKGSTPNTPITIPPPLPSITTTQSSKPIRESVLSQKITRAIKKFQKTSHDDDYGMRDGSLLSKQILSEVFPLKFKLPTLDKYDGTPDPRSHLAKFRTTMLLQNVNSFILCRVFPMTLIELVQKWYQRLPDDSIENFKQLVSLFK
ncbi:hypothetical protein P3X46_010920 [Hevea brasiliensis]|uniref:Retrotransposon gag domain-containing protein n=1 Tax=Hevea brasiliensis TaxID=3981 RepID=A0ABQ9MFZ3_HEVBR|nr:hypothetical protein P3X46_010920 [Hevea brasiliensis]